MKKLSLFSQGILAALIALVLEFLLFIIFDGSSNLNFFSSENIQLIFLVVTIEELFKLIFLWKIFSRRLFEKANTSDILFFGLGFSSIEAVFNLNKYFSSLDLSLITAFINVVLIHIITTFLASQAALALIKKNHVRTILLFASTLALHFSFNYVVLKEFNPSILFLVLAPLLLLSWRITTKILAK